MPILREYRDKYIIVLGRITILRSYEIKKKIHSIVVWYNILILRLYKPQPREAKQASISDLVIYSRFKFASFNHLGLYQDICTQINWMRNEMKQE